MDDNVKHAWELVQPLRSNPDWWTLEDYAALAQIDADTWMDRYHDEMDIEPEKVLALFTLVNALGAATRERDRLHAGILSVAEHSERFAEKHAGKDVAAESVFDVLARSMRALAANVPIDEERD
jgi:hypothetical protein